MKRIHNEYENAIISYMRIFKIKRGFKEAVV